jgi:HEAT repeat protein
MTVFCPGCFAERADAAGMCPSCGARSDDDDATYEEKLIRALEHPLPDRRLIAAEVLESLRSRRALPKLAELVLRDGDPYLSAAALRAILRTDPDHPVVHEARRRRHALLRAVLTDTPDTARGP